MSYSPTSPSTSARSDFTQPLDEFTSPSPVFGQNKPNGTTLKDLYNNPLVTDKNTPSTKNDMFTDNKDSEFITTEESNLLKSISELSVESKAKYQSLVIALTELIENIESFSNTNTMQAIEVIENLNNFIKRKGFNDYLLMVSKQNSNNNDNSASGKSASGNNKNDESKLNITNATTEVSDNNTKLLLTILKNNSAELLKKFTPENIIKMESQATILQKLHYLFLERYKRKNKLSTKQFAEQLYPTYGKGYSKPNLNKKMRWGELLYKYPLLFWCKFNLNHHLTEKDRDELDEWTNSNLDFVLSFRSIIDKICNKENSEDEMELEEDE
ncbi:hypothetical protein ABK040_007734 [Willaertia magna]